jgi:hypothetical protein
MVITKPTLDSSTITDEWAGSLPPMKEREIKHICRQLGIKEWTWKFKSYHYSTKSGPNGQALAASMADLKELPKELVDELLILGGNFVGSAINKLRADQSRLIDLWYKIFPGSTKGEFRKLALVADKEGKTRVVAILDYWSQTVLRPLHDHLNMVLRGIKADMTFNQDGFQSHLPSSGPYHSLDLTAATDRMPIALQRLVLSRMVGPDKAMAWSRVLVNWGYTYGDTKYFYNTGQPMGAYSSWAMMAITHHFIVRLAGLRCGFPHFSQYALLGDDIVIANTAVAEKYRELLSTLAMPISEQKTHVSNDTYEFAKRWIHSGVEVTPFSLSGLKETWKRYYLLQNFVETQQRHGWLRNDGDPDFLIDVVYQFKQKWRQVKSVQLLYHIFSDILAVLRRGSEDAAVSLSERLGLPIPQGYKPVEWITQLALYILKEQSEKEIDKLINFHEDFVAKIRDGIYDHLPDSAEVHTLPMIYTMMCPLVGIVKVLLMEHYQTIDTLKSGTEEEISRIILEKDLIGTGFSLEVFSMRRSKTRILSAARMNKVIWSTWKKYLHENQTHRYLT